VDALRSEQPGDGFFRSGDRLVVSEAAEYTIGCMKAGEHLNHFFLSRGVPEEVVPVIKTKSVFNALVIVTQRRISSADMKGLMWMSESCAMRKPSKALGRRASRMCRRVTSTSSRP
jgi:hypothetical protein